METNRNTHTEKPVYGVRPKEPGMYLGLFHGRERPDAVMDGWGFDGPVMGPLEFFHTTYANTIHLKFESIEDAELITGKSEVYLDLQLMDDLLCFDGKFLTTGRYTWWSRTNASGPTTPSAKPIAATCCANK